MSNHHDDNLLVPVLGLAYPDHLMSKRTTVSLPPDLHAELIAIARDQGVSADEIMREGIRAEVARRRSKHSFPNNLAWDEEVAFRFFASVPAPFVIKAIRDNPDVPEGKDARILWMNHQYSRDFQILLSSARGRTIEEIGLVIFRGKSSVAIQKLIEDKNPVATEEHILIGKIRKLYRVIRWFFTAGNESFVGDFSFDWNQMTNLPHTEEPTAVQRLAAAESKQGIGHVLMEAFESCSSALALKDSERRLFWCNDTYAQLAGAENAEELKGHLIEETWDLGKTHPAILDELNVVEKNAWMYSQEDLPDKHDAGKIKTRASLRFPVPIYENSPPFIGLVSLHLGTGDLHREVNQDVLTVGIRR